MMTTLRSKLAWLLWLPSLAAATLIGGLAASHAAHAEVAAADPIDVSMRQCLARRDRSSTAGQIQCMDETRDKWQAAMDAAYRQVLAAAPADDKRGWQDSQRHWLAWRKSEVHLLKAVYETTSGTMYAMASADMMLQPVRDRALSLRAAAARYAQQNDAKDAKNGKDAKGAKDSKDAKDAARRVTRCSDDADCEHAEFDLGRYYEKLRRKLPSRSRATLVRAEREWTAFRDAMTPLVTEDERVDLIGARVATIKRLSETVGNR